MNTFKKVTAASALLAFLASGAAAAAQVEVYGLVDTGLYYKNVKTEGYGAERTHAFTQESGIAGASRWGLRGSEKLGNGYRVGFLLEGKILTDDGTQGTEGQPWDRDSFLYVNTPYGNVQLGRTGLLSSGVSGGIFAGLTNPFGVVYKEAGALGVFQGAIQRASNMVRYESPSFAGARVYAQYSNGTGLSSDYSAGNDATPSSSRDRYGALGTTYRNGALRLAAVADYYWFNSADATYAVRKNPTSFSVAGSYDFGAVKVQGGYQYAKNLRTNIFGQNAQQGDGHIVMAGVSAPLFGGTAMAAAAYGHVGSFSIASDGNVDEKQLDAWQVSAGYKYPLSKRTMVYGALAYRDADLDCTRTSTKTSKKGKVTVTVSDRSKEIRTYSVMAGLQHKF